MTCPTTCSIKTHGQNVLRPSRFLDPIVGKDAGACVALAKSSKYAPTRGKPASPPRARAPPRARPPAACAACARKSAPPPAPAPPSAPQPRPPPPRRPRRARRRAARAAPAPRPRPRPSASEAASGGRRVTERRRRQRWRRRGEESAPFSPPPARPPPAAGSATFPCRDGCLRAPMRVSTTSRVTTVATGTNRVQQMSRPFWRRVTRHARRRRARGRGLRRWRDR